MFTGIIREIGRIARVTSRAAITRLAVSAPRTATSLSVGDSVALDGICLTVTRLGEDLVEVEATEETRRVTTLARWKAGDEVHLEPALRAGDPLGGHFVLGHVDGVGRVAALERRGAAAVLRVTVADAFASELVSKGSIAVDGVSLTLDEGPFRDSFAITLVPHTLGVTHLGRLRSGDQVNIELDILAKATHRPAQRGPALTLASLFSRGWQGRPR